MDSQHAQKKCSADDTLFCGSHRAKVVSGKGRIGGVIVGDAASTRATQLSTTQWAPILTAFPPALSSPHLATRQPPTLLVLDCTTRGRPVPIQQLMQTLTLVLAKCQLCRFMSFTAPQFNPLFPRLCYKAG